MLKTDRLMGVLGICVAVVALFAGGCTYLQNRGQDFTDIFDVGVTVSNEPQFALYAGFLNILSIGYADFEGTLYGMADRSYGAVEARQAAWGLLLAGKEHFVYDYSDLEMAEVPPPWGVGIAGRGARPPKSQIVNCPKILHLGWVGITVNCKFGELADFLLGWTTIDIMGDDN